MTESVQTNYPPLTEEELGQIEQLAARATPGPWFFNSYSLVGSVPMAALESELEKEHEAAGEPWDNDGDYPEPWKSRFEAVDTRVCSVPVVGGDTATFRGGNDAEFIVEARQHVPRLTAEVRRLWARVAELEKERDGMTILPYTNVVCLNRMVPLC